MEMLSSLTTKMSIVQGPERCEFRLHLAKQLFGAFSSRSENRKQTLKAAFQEPCVSPDNAVGHFISRREGNAGKRHCVQDKWEGQKSKCNRAKLKIYECAQCGIALCKDPSFICYLMYTQESNQPFSGFLHHILLT